MRILITADPMIPVPPKGYGGIERIVDSLVRCYAAAGHEVGLIAHRDSTCPATRGFAWPTENPSPKISVATIRNALALRDAVRAFQPDVLHSFSRLASLLFVLHSRLPKIMSYQRHTGPVQIVLARRLSRDSLRFTGCSEYICRQGRAGGGDWTAIPNFVDLTKIDFRPSVPADAPLVFLSRVESIKGPDIAIAVARAAGRRLVIAGNHATSGTEADFWNARIRSEIGRDGIEYMGEVDDVRKNTLLGDAAALLVPIQWDEPFGIVFAEALAAGTPIITCARGALPEIVTPGHNGFFMRTVDDGVASIHRLAELKRSACRADAEKRFSVEACARQYLELYRRSF